MIDTLLAPDSSWPKAPVARMPLNGAGRDWLVGDLHGACDLLQKALARVGFDPQRDRLFSLGDMIDRGEQAMELLRLSQEDWFHAIRGNHEQACLDLHAEHTLLNHKMDPTALKCGARLLGEGWLRRLSPSEQMEVIHILLDLPVLMPVETKHGTIGLVHAEVPVQCSWAALERAVLDLPDHLLVCNAAICSRRIPQSLADDYSRKMMVPPPQVSGVERVYHGHVSVHWPFRYENRFYIDTKAWAAAGQAESWAALTLVQLDVGTATFERLAASKPIEGIRIIADD